VPTIDQPPLFLEEPFDLGKHTVAYEARYVKALFSKVA
jgi:tetratricopeptide repeat protein 30